MLSRLIVQVLFSPLYWITDKQEVLLIAQALVVGLSGLIIYVLGKKILKNPSTPLRTSRLASLSILISYYLFIGLQNAVISDFHEVTIATLPLAFTFWAIIERDNNSADRSVRVAFMFSII